MDYFSDMGLVSLPAFTSAQLDIATGDPGSPVYIPKRDANNRIILAYPAGLFDSYCVDYTVVLTPQGWIHIPLHPHESCFFYHPLDRILADNPDLELILSPENEN